MTDEEDAQLGTQDEVGQDGPDDTAENGSDDLGKALEVLAYVARNIAKDPDAVRVYGTREGNIVNLKVSAAKSDMGRLIGRGGRVANAIRVLVRAAGSLDHLNTNVEFVDN